MEVAPNSDTGELLAATKRQVDNIEAWPEEAKQPIYQERYARPYIATVSVHGSTDRLTLKRAAQKVARGLLALPQVSEARLVSVPD